MVHDKWIPEWNRYFDDSLRVENNLRYEKISNWRKQGLFHERNLSYTAER